MSDRLGHAYPRRACDRGYDGWPDNYWRLHGCQRTALLSRCSRGRQHRDGEPDDHRRLDHYFCDRGRNSQWQLQERSRLELLKKSDLKFVDLVAKIFGSLRLIRDLQRRESALKCFLSQPLLNSDRENAGNPNLVPPQSWEAETEFSHDLGRWGKTRLNLHYYRVTDIIDVIPIGTNEQGIGNLPSAIKAGAETTSTILLDPLGFKGAKLDLNAGFEWSSVKDPLTGVNRPISGNYDRWGNAELRHDVPGTPFAWGVNVQYNHFAKNYFLTEIIRTLDIPLAFGAFVEHKNVMGLTVRASVFNVFGGRHGLHTVDRVVYSGFRDRAPVAFYEKHDDLVGPLFNFSVKGTF